MNSKKIDVSYSFAVTLDGKVKFTTEFVGDHTESQIMTPETAEQLSASLADAAKKARKVAS